MVRDLEDDKETAATEIYGAEKAKEVVQLCIESYVLDFQLA